MQEMELNHFVVLHHHSILQNCEQCWWKMGLMLEGRDNYPHRRRCLVIYRKCEFEDYKLSSLFVLVDIQGINICQFVDQICLVVWRHSSCSINIQNCINDHIGVPFQKETHRE